MKKAGKYLLIVLISAFALMTLFLSSSVIFDWFGIREKEGNYVLFIVWANLISSILYIVSVFGLIKNEKWAIKSLLVSATLLIIAQVGLFIHINGGGIYETKTVGAMFFRIALTLVFTLFAFLIVRRPKKLKSEKKV